MMETAPRKKAKGESCMREYFTGSNAATRPSVAESNVFNWVEAVRAGMQFAELSATEEFAVLAAEGGPLLGGAGMGNRRVLRGGGHENESSAWESGAWARLRLDGGLTLFAAEAVAEGKQRAKREDVQEGEGDGDAEVIHRDGCPDDAGVPDAGGRRRASYTDAFLYDDAAADKAYTRYKALQKTRLIGAIWLWTE